MINPVYIKAFIDIWDKAKTWPIVEKISKKIKRNNPRVLIIGSGGVGKTTLGNMLNGQNISVLDMHGNYEESLDFEVLRVSDNKCKADIEVTPGQGYRLDTMWNDISRNIEDGYYIGVIYVCAYGYHSIGNIDYKKISEYTPGDTVNQFIQKYTHNRREREIDLLQRMSKPIIANSKPMWLLNFIGKQDLWNRNYSDVENHYTLGKYSSIIDEIKLKKHENNFRVETVLGCLTIGGFTTAWGDTLCKNCSGYGNKEQAISLNRLINSVKALLMWKKSW